MSRIAIIGDGGWGTALAISAVRAGHDVSLWSAFADYAAQFAASRENVKFLPGITVPEEIAITADPAEALSGADLAVSAIPTQFVRETISRISTALPAGCTIASASKGLERGTLQRPSQILAEVAAGMESGVVLCGETATLVAANSESVPECQRGARGCGGHEVQGTCFSVHAHVEVHVGMAGQGRGVVAGQ